MSKFNKAVRLAKRMKKLYARSLKGNDKILQMLNAGEITQKEYNSLCD